MAGATEMLLIAAVVGIFALAAIILLGTRSRGSLKLGKGVVLSEKKETEKTPQEEMTKPIGTPQTVASVYTSVSKEDVQKAEEDLRILSVEKEIVSYALTRLYEAQAEGKITENDKAKLLGKYKDEMNGLEKQMNDKQMVVRLHELESTQADLVKLFQEKFEEINRNIDNIRTSLQLSPQPSKQPEPSEEKKETSPKEEEKEATEENKEAATEETKEKAPQRPRKSKAEEKVEAIQQEVLKILERLEKQEAEG
jgi:hypothetical protein